MRLELTKRGDYAVRAMLALARAAGDGRVAVPRRTNGTPGTDGRPGIARAPLLSARRIADAMAIPVRFLPQVLADLSHAGLVRAEAGRAGGYRLARPAESITLLEVIEAVEGDSRRRTCVLRGGPCGRDGSCDVHGVFFAGQEALLETLSGASLADLATAPGVAGVSPERLEPVRR